MHVGTQNPAYEYFILHARSKTGNNRGGEGHRSDSGKKSQAISTVQQSGRTGNSSRSSEETSTTGTDSRSWGFISNMWDYVRPHLEFSAPAWSPWLQGDKDPLEKVQEKAVKVVAGLKGTGFLENVPSWGWTHWRRGDRTKTWPWCTNSSPSPAQLDKPCSTYRMEPGQDRPLEDTAGRPVCQNRHPEIFIICSKICGVLEIGCPRNEKKISVQTETRSVSCLVRFVSWNQNFFSSVCFGVSNLYRNNWNKQNWFETNRNNPEFSDK